MIKASENGGRGVFMYPGMVLWKQGSRVKRAVKGRKVIGIMERFRK